MRQPQRQKSRILTATERGNLKAQLGDGPLGIAPADIGYGMTGLSWYQAPHAQPLNPIEVAAKKARVQAILDAGSPHDEKRHYRAWCDKRIHELEDELRKDVIPTSFYQMKRNTTKDYDKVVKTLVEQMQDVNRKSKENELKNLLREREPDDPDAGKLTYLRDDRRIQA